MELARAWVERSRNPHPEDLLGNQISFSSTFKRAFKKQIKGNVDDEVY